MKNERYKHVTMALKLRHRKFTREKICGRLHALVYGGSPKITQFSYFSQLSAGITDLRLVPL